MDRHEPEIVDLPQNIDPTSTQKCLQERTTLEITATLIHIVCMTLEVVVCMTLEVVVCMTLEVVAYRIRL